MPKAVVTALVKKCHVRGLKQPACVPVVVDRER
jgi:hypothetical protein